MKRRQVDRSGVPWEARAAVHVPIPLAVYMDIRMIREERSSARGYSEILDYARRWNLEGTVRWLEDHRRAYIEGSHVGFAIGVATASLEIEEESHHAPQT